jgi:hypothetical protein
VNALKVALVVPDYSHAWDDDRQFRLSQLTRACHAGEIDLVVFPEAYKSVPVSEAQGSIDWWASTLKVPVLMGVEGDGFQLAVYRNPTPEGDDTPMHVYVKHATAVRLATPVPAEDQPAASAGLDRTVRPVFVLANQHRRWELNDLARRLDSQPAAVELCEGLGPAPARSVSGLRPDGYRMLPAIGELPEDSGRSST